MPYFNNCGAMVPDNAVFCQRCGQQQKPVATATPTRFGLSENTAALLSYVFGCIRWSRLALCT